MSIRAVIFDVGGVLIRARDTAKRAKWEQRLGLAKGDLPVLVFESEMSELATYGEATADDVWRDIADRFDLTDEEMARLKEEFWAADRLDQELVGFLRDLRPRYKTGILSNAWPQARRWLTEDYGLDGVVDVMVFSAEERLAKPDPRFYKIVTDRLGVRPDESVFVDDSEKNVRAARRLGMKAIRFRDTRQTIADVCEYLDEKAPQRP